MRYNEVGSFQRKQRKKAPMKRIAKPSPIIRSTPQRHAERAHHSSEDPGPARKKLLFALLFIILLAGTFAIQLLAHAESPSLRPAQRTFHRLPDRYAKSIQTFHSSCDRDRDGIDDQTDILQGALRYLSTNPRYQSRNYPTGYPDDACGICTDVIAFALRDAGYDLLSLMREDIRSSPSSYPFATPESSIDFRRVQNQHAFLARHAISKTLDLHQLDAWQGGDIVIFEGHIGIVSDHRNARGIPYLLHHASSDQANYEEDLLEKRNDIIGHYRMAE